jgi:hypothetical protein
MEAIPKSWTPIVRCLPSPMAVAEVNPILCHVARPPLAPLAERLIQTP